MHKKQYTILGYSGHAYVVIEAAMCLNLTVVGYYNPKEVDHNPFGLAYKGYESDKNATIWNSTESVLLGIGNNEIRTRLGLQVLKNGLDLPSLLHPEASVSSYSKIGQGSFIARGASINPFAMVGSFAIVNTNSSIDHECEIQDGAHIGPGAILAGNVKIGRNSFIGANAVIKEGIKIGENVIVGAGAVVLNDINDNLKYVGNPAKAISSI